MLGLQDLLAELDYDKSPFYRRDENEFEPETVHLFRAAHDIVADGRVDGIYVFETSPHNDQHILPAQPAVYVATASTEEDAEKIHRSLWNLCYAPFLIVTLPHQIRIYTGFNYSPSPNNKGLLDHIDTPDRLHILKHFTAVAVDSKHIWQSPYGKQLNPNQRVDKRLLQSLQQLEDILKKHKLRSEIAHALIGKYVYFSYLRDRRILSNTWLRQQGIDPQDIFTYKATVSSLRNLTDVLETRFNGRIFPIDFDAENSLKDEHVSWVASVFTGDKIDDTPEVVRQLHLPFQAYDFKYIPVETLSTIYEQFIHEREKKGAVYTPEILADYLLSEMEWAKELQKGMSILDPACGSGVFLVLAYRRLIEKEMVQQGRRLQPTELRDILVQSVYGVERELDACFVTEFSLILTLLHYIKPPELHKNRDFQFPTLHNEQIFHGDFFDPESKFSKLSLRFDWIVGNPPWVKVNKKEQTQAGQWMEKNSAIYPVGDKSVAEAFSWRITKFLKTDGLAGLLMPATSLVNVKSKPYRQRFFSAFDVLRITNFANLREVLFDKRSTLPAATLIYQITREETFPPPIVHFGPFSINQVANSKNRSWVLTINENEIQTIDPEEARFGETTTWKLALWGNHRDKRALERLNFLCPHTLEEFCQLHGWGERLPRQGAELNKDERKPLAKIQAPRFDTDTFNSIEPQYRFSIPQDEVLQDVAGEWYIRRGEDTFYLTTPAPHMIFSTSWQNFAIFSDKSFIIPPRQYTIPCPNTKRDKLYLKALVVYLSSSTVAYYLFFSVPQWGFFSQRQSTVTREVRRIPVFDISFQQAKELAELYDNLVFLEQREIKKFVAEIRASMADQSLIDNKQQEPNSPNLPYLPANLSKSDKKRVAEFSIQLRNALQDQLDNRLQEILNLPDDLYLLSKEFVQTRLALDTPSALSKITAPPGQNELLNYAQELRDELDSFSMGSAYHLVTITYSDEWIECVVEITQQQKPYPITEDNIQTGDSNLFSELRDSLQEPFSQWAYIQRGLRLFDGPRVYLYKPARLIDWTRTQALEDANDIINSVLAPVSA